MDHLTTTIVRQAPGQTYGEACWATLTPEWAAWISDANDDWIENEIRRLASRMTDSPLSAQDDIDMTALIHEAKRRGLRG